MVGSHGVIVRASSGASHGKIIFFSIDFDMIWMEWNLLELGDVDQSVAVSQCRFYWCWTLPAWAVVPINAGNAPKNVGEVPTNMGIVHLA